MTSEEKAKLYQAIGYHEDGIDLQLPEEYVALKAHFSLKLLEVCVRNEVTHASHSKLNVDDAVDKMQTILSLQVSGVSCEVDQRPAASGLKLDLNMKEFTVFGYKQADVVPVVVKSILGQTVDNSLLDIRFEMNPLDKVNEFWCFLIDFFFWNFHSFVFCFRDAISVLMSVHDLCKSSTMPKQLSSCCKCSKCPRMRIFQSMADRMSNRFKFICS